MNIGTQDEILIRVISKRQALEEVVSNLSKIKKYLLKADYNAVSARWMTVLRKKVYEIEAATIELMGASSSVSGVSEDGDILTFGEMEAPAAAEADVLMDDEEVPF